MHTMGRLKEIIGKANMIGFCLMVLVGINLTRIIVHLPFDIFGIEDIQWSEQPLATPEKPDLTAGMLILALVIAPILETAFFQTLIYKLSKWLHFNHITTVLISAVCFGLMHTYSLFYMISTFFTGIIFMYVYIIRSEYNNRPYWSVTLAHFTLNAFASLMMLLFQIR